MTVKARSISCPNCGGPVQLRGFAHTLTVVCQQCMTVLDTSTPEVQILQTFQAKERIQPKIPLGSRSKLGDTQWEVIGFQVRQIVADEDLFTWDEYLLFNPFQGFRYLTEYQGHWNFVRVMSALPEETRSRGRFAVRMESRNYLRFDSLTARTVYVLGEFPWQVRVGDSAVCEDFIAPPYMLSSESTDGETTWSRGEYILGTELWQAFRLSGSAPLRAGIFANQPSPYAGKVGSSWRTWLWLNVALAALAFFFLIYSPGRVAFNNDYVMVPGAKPDGAFVTPSFQLTGRQSNVQVNIRTNLYNNWAYFNLALINEQTGQAFDFGREVSYYRDSEGSEGSQNNSVIISSVPSGQYYLRVEPEMEANAPVMSYELSLRRDVANFAFFWIAALLLLIPPVVKTIRSAGFEAARWRESDFAPAVSAALSARGGDDD